MIHIFTMAFNEEVLLPFMIGHYRSRFPGCAITIYDNYSTDKTHSIAESNNCQVIMYNTNNTVDDFKLTNLKNSCWKSAKTNWVLVCDVDELLEINESQLRDEERKGTSLIRAIGYNMVNMEDNFDFANIKYGSRCPPYDKNYLFNKRSIREINYTHGAHKCNPIGNIKYSDNHYTLYHHNGYNIEYLVQRHLLTASRMSENNKRNKLGFQYLTPPEQKRAEMLASRTYAEKIIP